MADTPADHPDKIALKTPITDDYFENRIGRPGEGTPAMLARRLELDRAALMEALETSLTRAYTAGHQRGHEDTVEGIFTAVWREDATTYLAEDVRLMLSDGSLPEAEAALAAARANFPIE